MLTDVRCVLGAVLAVTVLAVAGLGVLTSVALIRAAHMGPVEGSRSLAYAEPASRSEFYDPDAARRFADAAAKGSPTPAIPAEAPQPAVSVGTNPTAEPVEDKEAPPNLLVIPPVEPSPPALLEAAAPVEAPAPEGIASVERLASAPVTPPAVEPPPLSVSGATSAIDAPPSPIRSAQPAPQPRAKPPFRKRVARGHFRHSVVARLQTAQSSPFGSWPAFGTQFGNHFNNQFGTTTVWKRSFSRPQ